MSTAKRWAQERNWSNFRLLGVRSTLRGLLNSNVITEDEKAELEKSYKHISHTLKLWKFRSIASKEYCVNK